MLNLAVINGEKYISEIKKGIDDINPTEHYNIEVEPDSDTELSFYIKESGSQCMVRISWSNRRDDRAAVFNMRETDTSDFIIGIVSNIFEQLIGLDFMDIYDYMLSDVYGNEGNFYTTDMKKTINVSGIRVLYILLEIKYSTSMLDISRYLKKIEERGDSDLLILAGAFINKNAGDDETEKVFIYSKNRGQGICSESDDPGEYFEQCGEVELIEIEDSEAKVLAILQKDCNITQNELSDVTGIKIGTIKRILPKLQEKGILERVGNRRNGHWKIK